MLRIFPAVPDATSKATAPPRVSIVVPTRNRAGRLQGLIAALGAQTYTECFEVVVVDDGSVDSTLAFLSRAAETVPFPLIVQAGKEKGPAAARNLGWRRARGELIAFTDDDCEPHPEWLAAGVAAAAACPGSAVQGRTRPIEREFTRSGPRFRTKWIDGPGPWYQTCNMFYPREALAAVGGFDETFTKPFGEDADLAWRVLDRGVRIRFDPRALVYHAVAELSPAKYVRSGLRDPDEALIFKRHPGLRSAVARLHVFKSDQHALLPIAIAAVARAIARRHLEAAALAAPYALHLGLRLRASGGRPTDAPLVVAHDALELLAAARGALRHRVALI